jgi:hypothetical protein
MKDQTFVTRIWASVVEEAMRSYTKALKESEPPTDEYWTALRQLYDTLSPAQKKVLLAIMRQVAIDTVSHLFGILDGSSSIRGRFEDFDLIHRSSATKLDGDLQDLFLEIAEEKGLSLP